MSVRTAAAARLDVGEPQHGEGGSTTSRGTRKSGDPVVRRLAVIALLIVVIWLSGVVAALSMGILAPDAPRTSTERALALYEADVASEQMTPEKWADYIGVLTAAGQYGKAEQIIATAYKAVPDSKSLITLELARLHTARKEFDAALTSAEQTIVEAQEELAVLSKAAAEKGMPFTQERLEQEETAVLLMAEVYEAQGETQKAIEKYDLYLTYKPTAANVFVRRGTMKAEAGDTAGAEQDYREALRFVPDDADALAGLERIGASAK